ncbi:MAG: tRNA epoxyqueuosine(34) reductase QueG [Cyclobacteriaceae bacterium]|nr:tRNA epoxyqueuosine(34) reductase QueG [Cyclobacteriaceae bacterium]
MLHLYRMNQAARHSQQIKRIASQLGFAFCGIATAGFLEEEAPRLEQWLQRGYQGKMSYLENHFDKRLDPRKLVPGAKSVISLLYNYFPDTTYQEEGSLKLAKYAYGQDYHQVIKGKLREFMDRLHAEIGEVDGRVFVDSAPVHERAWAAKSGLGWIGKNSLLINRNGGSFYFLAELILDLEAVPDGPIKDYCGTCTRCMDACPTGAIPQAGLVDGSRCISYLTIELKEAIPVSFAGQMNDWIFGCDTCQDVCPWNRFASRHREPAFEPQGWESLSREEWQELTRDVFQQIFKKSAVKRAKYEGLQGNIRFVNFPSSS